MTLFSDDPSYVALRLAAIVDSSDDAILSKDLNGIISTWNAGAERIFGYTAEEMIGQSILRLIPPLLHPEEKEIVARLKKGERIDHYETIRMAKDGRLLNISITVSPIHDETGQVIGASKIARDITQKKETERALQEAIQSANEAREGAEAANRMKDEFLATLSHELRTPLNAILGWTNVLRLGRGLNEDLLQGLATIERNARAQAQIIEDLLDMSRIISGKIRLDVQRIEVSAVLQEAIETVRAAAEAKQIRLQVVMDPHVFPVSGDPNRLQQVFWNILSNAIKFTPKEGRVQILLERVNSHIEISVADTGEGIDPAFLPHIFDRFQQADGSTTRRHGGLGLGLSIVKHLVGLHGGSVQAKSPGLGQGTTFVVHLPFLAVHHEHEPERRHPQSAQVEPDPLPDISLRGKHVLVVDDEPDARGLVRRLLEISGASVACAASAEEGWTAFTKNRPDVLICDIGMPEEDGYSLIRRLRAIDQKFPALALTAYARSEDRTRAIRAGFNNHLSKPVNSTELLAVVDSLARQAS